MEPQPNRLSSNRVNFFANCEEVTGEESLPLTAPVAAAVYVLIGKLEARRALRLLSLSAPVLFVPLNALFRVIPLLFGPTLFARLRITVKNGAHA